ncbi:MAG TPA: HAD family phosphatase [Nocardioidaceae bacterium]|nr:HAD family phosphatase [Nocardioidaceae bacterium]
MSYEPAVDAVVLDIGGVVMDWDPRHLFGTVIEDEREREWFLAEVCSPAWNRRQDEGRSWADAVAQAVADHPQHEQWIRAYDERWIETVAGLYDETVAVLSELHDSDTPVYALTNFSAEKWALACEQYDLLNSFDGVVVSGEERLAKPDPAIYRLLAERFGIDPARTFFTDDLQANVDAARDAGIDAELFTTAAALRDQLVVRRVLRP